jgi:hypothetical protein
MYPEGSSQMHASFLHLTLYKMYGQSNAICFFMFRLVGVCSIVCNNSSYEMLSDYMTFKIRHRHRFTNAGRDPTNSVFLIWSPGFFGKLLDKFSAFQDTRIFMMMVTKVSIYCKNPIVPYKRNTQGRTTATLQALLFETLNPMAVAYRGGRVWGAQPPPPREITKFWQSWAEFLVPWNKHP